MINSNEVQYWYWIFLFICLLLLLGFAGSLLLQGLFSSCGKWGLLSSCCVQSYCDPMDCSPLGSIAGYESTCQCRRLGFSAWVRKTPWGRKQQPTQAFMPEESQGQRSFEATVHGFSKTQTWLSIWVHSTVVSEVGKMGSSS